jgi:hypothetical protein
MSQAPTPPVQPPAKKAAPASPPAPPSSPPAGQIPTTTTSPVPQKPLTDAEMSARSTKHAAWVAAGAALIAAIFALIGSVLTVTLTGNVETDRSRAEFLRGQRQELYSRIAIHLQAVNDLQATQEVQGKWGELDKYNGQAKQFEDIFQEAYGPLRYDQSSVKIIASQEVVDAFSEVLSCHRAFEDIIRRNYINPKDIEPSEYIAVKKVALTADDKFLAAARADMGAK